jgi:EAL domain-containing protein (putative c-di-GMP-specific phosphodiesterase class I)
MALDDTGSGHAGLEILSKLSVDFVKIDRLLLVKAIDDRTARGVLAGIIAIARETGSYLIAEGIENGAMLDFACDAHGAREVAFPGIRGVQGYLLGRPEVGQVNLRSLEQHHEYLETHRRHGIAVASGPKAA